ncbi:MAG: hypothetical protein M1838_006119 [Thelocarpon superellum]|nr:MAG: hypothetical protein M1838_006119 [Thelocarpon superellum]
MASWQLWSLCIAAATLVAADKATIAYNGYGTRITTGAQVAGATAASQAGAADHGGQEGPTTADMENMKYYVYLMAVLSSTIATTFCFQHLMRGMRYVRTIACLNNDTQRYFVIPNNALAHFKRHLLYAPLFRKRHSSEFSRAIDLGVLPTRVQSLFILGYVGTNVAFCLLSIDWSSPSTTVLAEFRNRTGILAVVNMVPLFIMGGRTNPLISLLNIPFDSFNLIHRWFGRIVVVEAVCHTCAYIISKVQTTGWRSVEAAMKEGNMIMGGLVGTIALVVILLQSFAAVRHAFYEIFLHLHLLLITVVVVGLWLHLQNLPQMTFLVAGVVIWSLLRSWRVVTLTYRNFGPGKTQAYVEVLPGDAVRVTLTMPRPWHSRPGQHLFLYVPSLSLWMSHPFSVVWSEQETDIGGEKGIVMDRQDIHTLRKSSVSLIIRRRVGFTEKLYKKAAQAPDQKFSVRAYVEGPYGGLQSLESYGTVMLFAGGVGITHQVPYVRQLVDGFANGTVAARKVVLVWVIRSPEHLEWIRSWMTTILAMPRRREVLRILLFVTRPRSSKEIHSPSATVQMFPGKPNVQTLITMESENQVGAMGVSVCGPGALADDVRRAVRQRQTICSVDFLEESYSW